MVKTDTTFACFNTGINELILKRNRNENALYISSIMGTDRPGYFKQQTGLYIAMLRDAKQRTVQIKNSPPPTWQDSPPSPAGVGAGVLLTPDEKQESILSEVKSRPWLILRPPRQKATCFTFCKDSPYDRVDPRTFLRSDPAPDYNIDARHVLVTAEPEEIASMGSISVDGVKFIGCSLLHSRNVYTKHANYDLESRKRLQWEAAVYSELSRLGTNGCIPEFFGFFRHANIERDGKKPTAGYLTLLLEHTGTSLAQLPHATWSDVALGRAIFNPDEAIKKKEHDDLDVILASYSLKRKSADE
ncbi:hypothetical protein C0992_011761 [Termitomyces sp. T32_za158]|nr:hypothetical protein C0992_011761 [Termitomyces sp. T32_za158]